MNTAKNKWSDISSIYDNFQTPMQVKPANSAGDMGSSRDLETSSLLRAKNLPPIGRRRHSTGAPSLGHDKLNEGASVSSLNDQEIVDWFRRKVVAKIWKGAFMSALTTTAIMICAVFLANFSIYSPIFTLIAILSPLLHPFKLITAIFLMFLGNLANSYALSNLYKNDNFRPATFRDESVIGCDLATLKLKIAVTFAMTIIYSFTSCFIWTCFVRDGDIDRSMCSSLFVGAIITSTFIIFYRRNYTLVIHSIKPPAEKWQFRRFLFKELYAHLYAQKEILHYSCIAWQAALFAQIAQNIGICIFGYLPMFASIATDLDAQFHFLLFNFAHILSGLYFHKFISHFILEPITFPFPEKYDIVDPSIEQKANIRNVLCSADDFLKMYAFHDLLYLSAEAPNLRRELVFELSIPGNNPLNWNSIKDACLAQISKLVIELKDARFRLGVAICDPINDEDDSFNQSMLMMNPVQRTQMYSMSVRRRQHAALRRKPVPMVKTPAVIAKKFISPYMERNVIMAIEAIVNLIICSLKEDRFGIVQKDRPLILRSLLQLSATIDKYSRERKATSMDDGINNNWILEVENVISRSIIAFHSSFKKYINSFGLSSDEHRLYSQIVFRRIYE